MRITIQKQHGMETTESPKDSDATEMMVFTFNFRALLPSEDFNKLITPVDMDPFAVQFKEIATSSIRDFTQQPKPRRAFIPNMSTSRTSRCSP
jgi:hypothetical protein